MKVELYTKDSKGNCKSVGEAYISGLPIIGDTVDSDKNVRWQIVSYASEYDRYAQFVGCSVEVVTPVKTPENL